MVNPIKVAHFIPTLGGGGAERQLCYLAESLVQKGIETDIYYCEDGPNSARMWRTGARCTILSKKYGQASTALDAISRLKRNRPDIIQTWLSGMDVVAGAAAKSMGIPYIVSERTNRLLAPRERYFPIHRAIVKKASAVVANSRKGLDYWRQHLPEDKLFFIPNSIPVQEINAISEISAAASQMRNELRWVLFAGRLLDKAKGLRTVIQVFDKIATIEADTGFAFAGTGPDRSLINNFRNKYPTRTLAFEYLDERELWSVMKRCSALISCSRFEGSPNVLAEACACGLPVVVSDIPEHRELLGSSFNRYIPQDSVDDFVSSLRNVLQNQRDSPTAFKAEKIQLSNLEQTCEQYINLYVKIKNQT
jgi:glycosyltransferase involved in cell wall biosynthesis